ncbi:MAG: hypothetical protein H8E82_07840 [Candidatus Marinimicrobia bacterium]|nr:hypothetical protein [Candidatus Neomarinimicrobiota bacterium]
MILWKLYDDSQVAIVEITSAPFGSDFGMKVTSAIYLFKINFIDVEEIKKMTFVK